MSSGSARDGVRDAVVVGLGVMGRAACRALARRGRSVLGLDRRGPAHRLGSSHGESRLIRALYHEGAEYLPLLEEARSGWRRLEAEAGRTLLVQTGGLVIGPPDGSLATGCRAAAERSGLPCEELEPGEVGRRFPAFRVPGEATVVLDPGAGVLLARRCMEALRAGAEAAGAELRFRAGAEAWARREDAIEVETASGTVAARTLLLAAGGWTPELMAGERPPLTVERQTVHHFRPPDGEPAYGPDRFPVFLLEREDGSVVYGAPDLGSGVKVALHYGGDEGARPDEVRRPATAGEGREARRAVEDLLPGLPDEPSSSRACLYTNTPDRGFLLGNLEPAAPGPAHRDEPAGGRVAVATGFSGHGFKFAPAVGRAAADLLDDEPPSVDLSAFRPDRWGRPPGGRD